MIRQIGATAPISTIIRWITHGSRGPDGAVVRLEGRRCGGRWLTTREALERFMDQLTPRFGDAPAPIPRSPAARTMASERAAAELEALGI